MPYRSMTLQDLAQLLGSDPRRVERMAKRGEIPCQKVGDQLRFNRTEIAQWLKQRMGTLDQGDLAEVDAGITSHREVREDQPIVTCLLRPEAVCVHLDARTKQSTLRKLVALATSTGLVYDPESLLEAVLRREALCSTALERGIAIPHPHHGLPHALAEPILVVARTDQGIPFGAQDRQPSSLFFLIASQHDAHHLHLLARLCRMLHDPGFPPQLEAADTAQAMIELLTARETQILSSLG